MGKKSRRANNRRRRQPGFRTFINSFRGEFSGSTKNITIGDLGLPARPARIHTLDIIVASNQPVTVWTSVVGSLDGDKSMVSQHSLPKTISTGNTARFKIKNPTKVNELFIEDDVIGVIHSGKTDATITFSGTVTFSLGREQPTVVS